MEIFEKPLRKVITGKGKARWYPELEDRLINEVVPDIIQCATENSEHNKSGHYGFDYCGKHLSIDFKWE